MALFDKMRDSISIAGQGVSQKAKTATESVRIGGLIKNNERMIEKLTYQVGVQCVSKYINDTDSEYKELFAEILRLRDENQRYRIELQQATAQNVCPQCGYGNNTAAKFCISCGAPLAAVPAGGIPCKNCGYMNTKDSAFCVQCGSPITKPEADADVPEADADIPEGEAEPQLEETASADTCKNCGAVLDDDSLFCTECGAKREP